jgi:hypothetical protein
MNAHDRIVKKLIELLGESNEKNFCYFRFIIEDSRGMIDGSEIGMTNDYPMIVDAVQEEGDDTHMKCLPIYGGVH